MFTDSYRPQINGMVTSIDAFTSILRKRRHEIHIFAPEAPNAPREKFVHRFHSVPFRAYKEYRIGVPYKMLTSSAIKEIGFDLVHVHSPFSMGVTGLAFAKYYKLPVAGTFHTMFPDYMHYFIRSERVHDSRMARSIFKKLTWNYLAWFYNGCDVVIAPSQSIAHELKKHEIYKPVSVIPTGIKIPKKSFDRKKLRKKYGFKKDEKIILHVGRITKEKNIESILQAFGKIRNNARIVIASDGPYKKELENLCQRLGVSKNVLFTGYLPENNLLEYYNLSDIFAMASESETQGLVLLEAALAGLPIVALDAPVTGDFVRKNGLGMVTKKHNLAKSMKKALNDRNMRKKMLARRKILINKYNIDNCTKDLIDVYSHFIMLKKNEVSLASRIRSVNLRHIKKYGLKSMSRLRRL
jgi:glycosyltransferase involved in cell wall biosynthesis